NIDLDHSSKVLSMQEDIEVQEVVEVVNAAKLITEVVTAAVSAPIPAIKPAVAAASTPISVAKPKVLKPEEELHKDTPAETLSVKDKGKGILIEDPKPMKKKDQIAMDVEYAKKLQEELEKEEEMEKKDEEIIKSINETPAQKAVKRKRLREQAKEDEALKKQLKLLELMLLKRSKENTKCVSAAAEELTAAKHKLELKLFRNAAAAAHM
nr:hypothetical protein [Tanacetum cinerariifolium]